MAEPPRVLFAVRKKVLAALRRSGFVVNLQKSQLAPTRTIEYLGLHLDFRHRVFQPQQRHLDKVAQLAQNPLALCNLSPRAQQRVRGYFDYVLSVTIKLFLPLVVPLAVASEIFLWLIRKGLFAIPMHTSTAPAVYVDATQEQVAYWDTGSGERWAARLPGSQAANELAALLAAFRRFGRSRYYVTDAVGLLSLYKRSRSAFTLRAHMAAANVRILWCCSACNLADEPSRSRPGTSYQAPTLCLGQCSAGPDKCYCMSTRHARVTLSAPPRRRGRLTNIIASVA